jgi:4a-hydroxytetrahydrobiopterin dehydratase
MSTIPLGERIHPPPGKKITEEPSMEENFCNLAAKRCKPCEGDASPLGKEEVERLLSSLSGWKYLDETITKRFEFKNYYQTMAFVNAVAWIAHTENHHPDMEVSYRTCLMRYSTHAVGGLSENDFICAAKVDTLIPA